MLQAQPMAFVYLGSMIPAVAIGVMAWRRRGNTLAAGALAMIMAGLAHWAGMDALATLVPDVDAKMFFALAIYPGVAAVVAGFFCMSLSLANQGWRLTRRVALLLCVQPAALIVVAATNPWHRQLVTHLEPDAAWGAPGWEVGPLFWVHSAYCYLLLGAGAVALLRSWVVAPPVYRRQLILLLVAPLFTVVGNGITVVGQGEGAFPDLTPVFFLGTALLDAWAIFRQGLFHLVPVARELVLERLRDGIVVVDPQNRVLDLNPAAEGMLRARQPELPATLIGLPGRELLARDVRDRPMVEGEQRIVVDGHEVAFDLQINELVDRAGRPVGRAFVLRDVTELQRHRHELALANGQLRDQLETIERLQRDLAEQVIRDPLTGLHNRRHLTVTLDRAVARACAGGEPLGVVILDIDHFKKINDGYGHALGDAYLVSAATMLAAHVRPGDTVARMGGEEFVVLLPGLDADAARRRTEELREACARVRVPGPDGDVATTVSAGVACAPVDGTTPEALLDAADRALYAAKHAGRNRVVLAA